MVDRFNSGRDRFITLLFYQHPLPTYIISGVGEKRGHMYHINKQKVNTTESQLCNPCKCLIHLLANNYCYYCHLCD